MPTLRNSVINQILDYLEYGEFCVEDFNSQFPDGSSVLAEITFKALPKYSFTMDESHAGGAIASSLVMMGQANVKQVIRTIERPGSYKNSETKNHDDIQSAIRRVSDWVVSIRDDLVNLRATVRSTIDEFTQEFQQSIDENINDPESYFEKEEQDSIKGKLDELQTRVSELESKLGISPEETKQIERVIEKSRSDLSVYPKGVWYKTAGNKLLKVMKATLKTQEGREILSDLAKKLLN